MKFSDTPLLYQVLPAWRARVVLVTLLLAFFALIGRSVYLQTVKRDFLQDEGDKRYAQTISLLANRGRVLDRHGDVLAVSAPVKSLYINSTQAKAVTRDQWLHAAVMLEMNPQDLLHRASTEKGFIAKRQVPPDIGEQLQAMKLPGFIFESEFHRFYPTGEVAAHMLGFTSVDEEGLAGIEQALNPELTGKDGERQVLKDRRGQVIDDLVEVDPAKDGKDVVLALDNKIQYLAYSRLKQAVTDNKAKAGSVVVLDVQTGEVLAMVNLPTYNPNNRGNASKDQLRNRALMDTFEPGSTMKPFTIALGLESGKYRPDTRVDTQGGRMSIGTATIHDSHEGGMMSVSQVIQKSSNVGASKIALSLPPESMWRMFATLGFGSRPHLGIPGEASGILRPWKNWRPIEQATMSFGHGISVSLLQLANAYLVFARDGDMVPISLTRVSAIPAQGRQIFSPRTAQEVRAMLETVVQPGGTAPQAAIAGYRVAGKTGTAHKLEAGHYADKYVASFVGFAPVSKPRLIIAVMVDEPSAGKYYGGEVAAPVFAEIMSDALRALGVAPDAPLKPLQLAKDAGYVKESM